jgi:hypothetical protein
MRELTTETQRLGEELREFWNWGYGWDAENVSKVGVFWPDIGAYGMIVKMDK